MRKVKGDTIAGRVLAEQQKFIAIPMPEWSGLDPEDQALWDVFSSSRDKTLWRDLDLFYLVKMIKIEKQLIANQKIIDEEGDIVDGYKGTKLMNARLHLADKLLKNQLSILAKLSLGVASTDGAMKNRAGQKSVDKVTTVDPDEEMRVL